MTVPARYRKLPVTIEAAQLTGFGPRDLMVFEWAASEAGSTPVSLDADTGEIHIRTLEGVMVASVGDYIIKGVHGELYPCKPNIFESAYEKVE